MNSEKEINPKIFTERKDKMPVRSFESSSFSIIIEAIDTFPERLDKCSENTKNTKLECIADTVMVIQINILMIKKFKTEKGLNKNQDDLLDVYYKNLEKLEERRRIMIAEINRQDLKGLEEKTKIEDMDDYDPLLNDFKEEMELLKKDIGKITGLDNF